MPGMYVGYGDTNPGAAYRLPGAPPSPPAPVYPGFPGGTPYGREEGYRAAGAPAPVGTPGLPTAPMAPVNPASQPAGAPSWLQQLFGGGQGAGMGMSAMLDRARMNPNLAGRI